MPRYTPAQQAHANARNAAHKKMSKLVRTYIREEMITQRMTMREMGRAVGYDYSEISQVLSGEHRLSVGLLFAMSKALKKRCTITWSDR